MKVMLKRAYDAPARTDGQRVLVDRLWPRGLTKARVKADLWLKEVAPSTALRTWFSHDSARWVEFTRRYRVELKGNPALAELKALARARTVTLVYAAKDPVHNHALVLKQELERL